MPPATDMFQDANVPEPPTKSTTTVIVVDEYAVIGPSIKFVGVTEYAILTRVPTAKATAVEAKLVVKVFDPVPTNVDVELVKPA
jgi:hypothetical protein